jgi:hypothetical protein
MSRDRVRVLRVERGLHTLRYRSASNFGASAPPVVSVRQLDDSDGVVWILSPPGAEPRILSRPGDALVVMAEQDGSLLLNISAAAPGGADDAEIELKSVSDSDAAASTNSVATNIARFKLCGHVSMVGDVVSEMGAWLCGPASPGRIEGIEIRPNGAPLPLEYAILSGGGPNAWSRWFPPGGFAGSRGKSKPLTGVKFRLVGETAGEFTIEGEANFLGAPVIRKSGREIELVGPSPFDPLVGLRLAVEHTAAAFAPPPAALTPQPAAIVASTPALQRVRTFSPRSSAASKTKAQSVFRVG